MKIVGDMICYQYKQYMFSAKWVMPFVLLVLFVASFYSMSPVEIVNGFAMTGLVLFVLMAWVGVTTQELEPEISEQVLILRFKSERKYYVCHILFLAVLCVIGIFVSMGIPLVKNLLVSGAMFSRKVEMLDVIGGFALLFACAFTGVMLGELFHVRVIKERTITVGATFFMVVFAVVRSGLVEKYPISRFLVWVVPPVSDVVSWFSNGSRFDTGKLLVGFTLLMLYAIIMVVIKVELLRLKKF